MLEQEEKYFSPEEVAQRFNLKAATVRKWIRKGHLRAVRFGDLWRIPESALAAFVKDSPPAGSGEEKGPAE